MSSFHGLEMAKQALFAQQSALYTTGHNISNVNTPGYSRQRVNFETMSSYPPASRNRAEIPGQMGTGVKAGTVERIRDKFLDSQFRAENSKSGYWETMSNALGRMENLMNETTDNGLSKSMDLFWESLQALAGNPENSGARSVVVQRGAAVAEAFNYYSESLNSIRSDLETQIEVGVTDANSLLYQINEINKQIKQIEPHGYLPNDLYDERDRLIDKLSNMVNIRVSYSKSGESSPDIANGLATIELLDENGKSIGVTLIDGADPDAKMEFKFEEGEPAFVTIDGNNFETLNSNGSLKALINAYGYKEGEELKGIYPEMLAEIDKMAASFVEKFNDVHAAGYGLDNTTDVKFFDENGTTAGSIKVSDEINNNPDLIAASIDGTSGNGENALDLAAVFDDKSVNLGTSTSVKSFYESLIGNLGVQTQEANRMSSNTGILLSQVENQRMSVSSVSLDEEISNMIKFQHAYNAAARNMTTIDEMLDRIINSMGLVGR